MHIDVLVIEDFILFKSEQRPRTEAERARYRTQFMLRLMHTMQSYADIDRNPPRRELLRFGIVVTTHCTCAVMGEPRATGKTIRKTMDLGSSFGNTRPS